MLVKGGKAHRARDSISDSDVFRHFYVNMVRSGEASGHLGRRVWRSSAAYLERSKAG